VRATILARSDASLDHTGFPVMSGDALVGVVTHRDLFESELDDDVTIEAVIRRRPLVVYPDTSLRAAADTMVMHDVGRVVVVTRSAKAEVVGILTRSDLLEAHRGRIGAETERTRVREAARPWRKLTA
jgi:CBS domain-containing protein